MAIHSLIDYTSAYMETNKASKKLIFDNPNGLFSIQYPNNYKIHFEDNILSIAAPKSNSSLTVSTLKFARELVDVEFAELFQRLTVKYEAIKEPFYKNENTLIQRLKSIKPDHHGDIVTTYWTICLQRTSSSAILVTVNVADHETTKTLNDYEEMISSIVN